MGLKLGLAALCVALCVAAAWQHTSHSVSLLNVKTAALEAAQDEKHFKTLFLDAHAESKEAAGHEKLAAKDVRVQRSLMLAADQLNSNRRAEDTKMQLLHRQQAELDAKLERLTTLWASQKTALEYASRQIQGFDYRLKGERSVLTSERSVVQHLRKKVKVLDEETNSARKKYPEALKQVSDAKRVLRKAEDALKDDRARAVAAGDKATYARSEEQLDLAKGRVAAKQSAMLTSEAVAAKGNNAAHAWQLKKRADQDKGEATVLRAKAAEAQSRAQVEQAKVGEMAADVHMMHADVVAAQTRLQRESSRAAMLAREKEEEGGLVGQTRAQGARERGEEARMRGLLRKDREFRNAARLGAAALHTSTAARHQDSTLATAVRQEEQGVGDAEVEDNAKARRDEAEAHAVGVAASEHKDAAVHMRAAAAAAAREAADLVHRATMLVGFAQEDKRALRDQTVLTKVQAARELVH